MPDELPAVPVTPLKYVAKHRETLGGMIAGDYTQDQAAAWLDNNQRTEALASGWWVPGVEVTTKQGKLRVDAAPAPDDASRTAEAPARGKDSAGKSAAEKDTK